MALRGPYKLSVSAEIVVQTEADCKQIPGDSSPKRRRLGEDSDLSRRFRAQ